MHRSIACAIISHLVGAAACFPDIEDRLYEASFAAVAATDRLIFAAGFFTTGTYVPVLYRAETHTQDSSSAQPVLTYWAASAALEGLSSVARDGWDGGNRPPPMSIRADGDVLFVATDRLEALSISDGSARAVVGSIALPSAALDLAAGDGRAVVATSTGLYVYDVSDPRQMLLLGSFSQDDVHGFQRVALTSSHVCALTVRTDSEGIGAEIFILDLGNPAAPRLTARLSGLDAETTNGFTPGLAADAGKCVATEFDAGNQVARLGLITVTGTGETHISLEQVPLAEPISAVLLSNRALFVAAGNKVVRIDAVDGTRALHVSPTSTPFAGVLASGDRVYAFQPGGDRLLQLLGSDAFVALEPDPGSAADNLLANPGFESGAPDAWDCVANGGAATVVQEHAHAGSFALRLSPHPTQSVRTRCYQQLTLLQDQDYRLSAFSEADNDSIHAQLRAVSVTGVDLAREQDFLVGTSYSSQTLGFNTGTSTSVYIELQVFGQQIGTVYFDAAELVVVK